MKKFVMLDSHTFPDADFHQEIELLKKSGFECVLAQCKSLEDVVRCAGDAECIGVNYFRVTDEVLAALPRCKAVLRYGIGYDVVDVEACTRRNVLLCNLPDYCISDVATHTMALILDLVRKTTLFDRRVRSGFWDVGYGYGIHRMDSLTLGLIGFGNIARLVTSYAQCFGMKVIASDPYITAELMSEYGVEKVTQDELLARSDIISIHTSLIPSTYHLIDREAISKMKDGMIFINTARGAIADVDALYDALQSGKIRAAGLDVVEGEPISNPSQRLWKCETLVITPHSAYNSVEASDAQHSQIAKLAVEVLSGMQPRLANIVNRKELGLA